MPERADGLLFFYKKLHVYGWRLLVYQPRVYTCIIALAFGVGVGEEKRGKKWGRFPPAKTVGKNFLCCPKTDLLCLYFYFVFSWEWGRGERERADSLFLFLLPSSPPLPSPSPSTHSFVSCSIHGNYIVLQIGDEYFLHLCLSSSWSFVCLWEIQGMKQELKEEKRKKEARWFSVS